ncbi:hypothetical protein ACTG9Q_21495 [Actinokineospora sp. 24-640]
MTDTELGMVAHRLGQKIVEMYAKAEIGSVGGFGPNHDATLVESVLLDAMDFATLDPQKIIDESERMRGVRSALGEDQQARADIDQAATSLAVNWTGEAADRFHDQMKFIEYYLTDHAELAERAFLAMGMAFAVSVRVRQNFRELAEGAIVACDQEMAAQEVRTAEADIKRSATVINSVLEMFSNSPAELLKGGIQGLVNVTATELEIDLKTSGAVQVVEAYTRGRDMLRRDFEDAMLQIEQWLDRQMAAMGRESVALLRPLPASYSPSSPDFRYEQFASDYRPSEEFGSAVEKRRAAEREPDPKSIVTRRLGAQ